MFQRENAWQKKVKEYIDSLGNDYEFDDTDEESPTGENVDTSEGAQEKTHSPNKGFLLGFMSGKGGTGKTSLAINVANFCVENGKRVLLVDCDINTSGATTFFESQGDLENAITRGAQILSLHDIISDATATSDDSKKTNTEENNHLQMELFLVKPNFSFIPVHTDGSIFPPINDLKSIQKYMDNHYFSKWITEYDLIILDFGAGGQGLVEALADYCQKVCVVSTKDSLSINTAQRQLVQLSRRRHRSIAWCINMHTGLTHQSAANSGYPEFYGFKYNRKYANLYEGGRMIESSDRALYRRLSIIVRKIYNNFDKSS